MPCFREHRPRIQVLQLAPEFLALCLRKAMRVREHEGVRAPELPGRLAQQPARQQVSSAKRAERVDEDEVQVLL